MKKNTYLQSGKKETCYGCSACEAVCPVNAIKMTKDEHGFFYPEVNERICTNCGLCKAVCPNDISMEKTIPVSAIVGSHCEKHIFYNSASGGAFSAIASMWNDGNTYVAGAIMDENFQVIHSIIKFSDGIKRIRKSKYVQSNLQGLYEKIESLLNNEEFVVFSGTPCQIAALKGYLRKDYYKLLCVDLVCHGVPSNQLFNLYIEWLEKKHKKKVKEYVFRSKYPYKGCVNTRSAIVRFENEEEIYLTPSNDPYLRLYNNRYAYRPACYSCKFSCEERISDITLGDAWGIEEKMPCYSSVAGVSAIFVNTEKGKEVVNKLECNFKADEAEVAFLIQNNKNMMHSTIEPINNDIFMKKYRECASLAVATAKYTYRKILNRIVFKIRCRCKSTKIIRKER